VFGIVPLSLFQLPGLGKVAIPHRTTGSGMKGHPDIINLLNDLLTN